jgi:phage gp29-like protein
MSGVIQRFSRIMNRALASVSYRFHVAAANAWRDHYNPLRNLTISRAVCLLEDGERGAMADLQWTYRYIEMQDATLGALVERRTSAIQELDWDIPIRQDVPKDKKEVAARQEAALRSAYKRISNLSAAFEAMAMASFRGFARLEKVTDENGDIVELLPVDQWFWVRKGLYGPWQYNRNATFGCTSGDAVPEPRFITREVSRPINRVALVAFVRKGLSQKDWDGFIETYGIPAVFVIMPENVPTDKTDAYLDAADRVTSDARGVLPGGSDIKTVDNGARGNNPFKDHIAYQDEQVVLRGTGGKLTMLAESGSGTLAGSAHADTFAAIARAEAKEISEIFRAAIDAEIIERVTPGEEAWAGFQLAANEEQDSAQIVRDACLLNKSGFAVDPAYVEEKTGYKLTPAAATPPAPAPDTRLVNRLVRILNRVPAPAPVQKDEVPRELQAAREALAEDLRPLCDALFSASQAGDLPAIQAALKKISKEAPDFIKSDALADVLGEEMAAALTASEPAPIRNSGNSDGARKGWETRRREGWQPKRRPQGSGAPGKRRQVEDVEHVLDAAFLDPDNRDFAVYADLDGATSDKIRAATKASGHEAPDLSGWKRIVEADKVNKILTKHITDAHPVEEEDFRRLPELLAKATVQKWEAETGKPPRLRSEIPDGRSVIVVEEAYTGKKTLTTLSIYRP